MLLNRAVDTIGCLPEELKLIDKMEIARLSSNTSLARAFGLTGAQQGLPPPQELAKIINDRIVDASGRITDEAFAYCVAAFRYSSLAGDPRGTILSLFSYFTIQVFLERELALYQTKKPLVGSRPDTVILDDPELSAAVNPPAQEGVQKPKTADEQLATDMEKDLEAKKEPEKTASGIPVIGSAPTVVKKPATVVPPKK